MRNKNAKVSNPNDFVTDPGSPDRVLYSAKVQPDGSLKIVECGKEDLQAKIESFRDSTDMNYILKQLALGNVGVLAVHPGQYGDFTQQPKTMAEALQLQIDAENAWYRLPVDIRAKFDHDLNKWLVTAGSEEWNKAMFPEKSNSLNDISGEPLVGTEKEGE